LANVEVSCEYLTSDKSCTAVSENKKAIAVRQTHCKNDEKLSCCYLCLHRHECPLNCTFLGKMGKEPSHIEDTNSEAAKSDVGLTTNAPAITCSSCKATMREGKTKLRISGWEDSGQKLIGGDLEAPEKEWLPVTVNLCPQCGKIEFVAEEEAKQKLITLICQSNR
jgi:hypothetical protein